MPTQLDHWVCPHCQKAQILPEEKQSFLAVEIDIPGLDTPNATWRLLSQGCVNPVCRKLSSVATIQADVYQHGYAHTKTLATHRMLPRGDSKPQPAFIPYALREDYDEACAIRELSPKAAATLVRRCLQGMIRDFCGITDKPTLFREIEALKAMVDDGRAPSGVTAESIEAIDQVRGIGNIGAHMEHDINLIVDVDPNEAQVLIELVEMLFAEWYVARHQRQERLAEIKRIAAAKKEAREPRAEGDALADEGTA